MRSLLDGLKFHVSSIKSGFEPTVVSNNQLIHLYANHALIQEAQNLFDGMPERNVFTWNVIINAHIKARNFIEAESLFLAAPDKDSVTYNSMLSGYVNHDGCETRAVKLFLKMQSNSEKARIDGFSLTSMQTLTAKLGVLSYGKQLHSYMLKTANDLSGFAVSSLIDMYSKCGSFQDSQRVFDGFGDTMIDVVVKNAMVAACFRGGELDAAWNLFWTETELMNTVSWNTMISGYARNGYEEVAIQLFKCMAGEGYRVDEHTCSNVLSACSGLKSLKIVKEIHAWILKAGMISNSFPSSGTPDDYYRGGNLRNTESAQRRIQAENSFLLTSMIVAYFESTNLSNARKLSDSLSTECSSAWTAMIRGYVKCQEYEHAFELFRVLMEKEATTFDNVLFVSMLGACTLVANLDFGKGIHAYLLKARIKVDPVMASALIDMYAKCGNIAYAKSIFQGASERDAVLYNVMMAAYAHHGHKHDAMQHFAEMLGSDYQPDAATFLAVLSACRHCGLVEKGEKYFLSMIEDYGISPESDHYACMIDLYGRTNQLEKAYELIKNIPMEPDIVVLSTFLTACRLNRNVPLAGVAEVKLLKVEGDSGAHYMQLANMYASEGKWEDMGCILKKMRGKEMRKLPGCSWLHLENRLHVFTSSDTFHFRRGPVYAILRSLKEELKEKTESVSELELVDVQYAGV